MAKFRGFIEVEAADQNEALESIDTLVKQTITEKESVKDIIKMEQVRVPVSSSGNKKLYIGNLSYDTTEDQLKEHFSSVGEVKSVKVIKEPSTDKSRGFAFIEMENSTQAIEQLDEQPFMGRNLRVREAENKPMNKSNDKGGDRNTYRNKY